MRIIRLSDGVRVGNSCINELAVVATQQFRAGFARKVDRRTRDSERQTDREAPDTIFEVERRVENLSNPRGCRQDVASTTRYRSDWTSRAVERAAKLADNALDFDNLIC
jgi:hypothetical protein